MDYPHIIFKTTQTLQCHTFHPQTKLLPVINDTQNPPHDIIVTSRKLMEHFLAHIQMLVTSK